MAVTSTSTPKNLSLLGFFAITASMVMAVYEYPTFATSGFSLVFFLLLGGLLWFIPVALCAAEMATVEGWEEGGLCMGIKHTRRTVGICSNFLWLFANCYRFYSHAVLCAGGLVLYPELAGFKY